MAGEKLITVTIKGFCKNHSAGCPVRLNLYELALHEEDCEFRTYPCPYPVGSCNWSGSSDDVIRHLRSTHGIGSRMGESCLISVREINMTGPFYWVVSLFCYDRPFVVIIGKQNRGEIEQCFVIIHLVGSKGLCKKFSCRVELTGKDGKKYVWYGPPQTIFDEIVSIIENNACFLFDSVTAKFCSFRETLLLSLSITMDPNPEPELGNVDPAVSTLQQLNQD